jgi:regulation of enolase protein 1 (concanavalin A-like superfamily)
MNSSTRRVLLRGLFASMTASLVTGSALHAADKEEPAGLPFRDTFRPKPDAGWRWVREDPKGWRVGAGGLEVRVGPGNMWGGANDATNVLVRPAPDPKQRPVEITAHAFNKPTHQWEQVDLVWYYDDSNMVKLGQELVDGRLSVVMGREEKDRTRTIAIIPLDSDSVELRLGVRGDKVRGRFKTPKGEWKDAGECDLPAPPNARPHVSLQFYRGNPADEHWARVSEVTVRAMD